MLLALIRKEFLALSRDLHGLAALFILPVIFIILMSLALKDVYSPHVAQLQWSVLDEDNSDASQLLIAEWGKNSGSPIALPDNWEKAVREGKLSYVIRISAGAGEALGKTESPDRPPLLLIAEPAMDIGVFSALNASIQAAAIRARLGLFIQMAAPGATTVTAATFNGELLAKAERLSLIKASTITSVQHNVPAWLVFGMFFVVTTIAGLLVEERSTGCLNRLLSLGASPLTILLAKVIPFLFINCLQSVLMLAVGIYIIPLLGGDALSLQGVDYLALAAILVCISLAAISLALLVATLVKSQAQASTIGPMMNILMAAIGGIMVPTFVMPASMQQLSHLSPMNWALEGLLDVLLRGGDLYSLGSEMIKLLALAVICICLAYLLFRFKKS
ncbi:MAG TPA: ABC transporter permease [Cellvibrio sp.]|nr:ABC transporter permease [Cellvibrio sp.]